MREDFPFFWICGKRREFRFESDQKRLRKIGKEKEFCEIIRFMLEKNIKLEQECIGETHAVRQTVDHC